MPTDLESAGPRIAILVSGRQVASRERMFFRIAAHLAARGAAVEFLAAGPEPELEAALRGSALRDISPLPRRVFGLRVPHGLRLAASLLPLARLLRNGDAHILFTTSIPPNLIGLLANRLAGSTARIILRQSNTLHLNDAAYAAIAGNWRDRLVPRLYRRADAIIANSGGVARNLAAAGLSSERITTIPNGIDCGWIAAQARLHTTLPAAPERKTIVAVGRLVPQKDHATLLRAVALAQGEMPCRLVLIGSGPERAALERLAGSLGIADLVSFLGYRANPYPYIAAADLFVLSSRHEGMPNVLLEALACGRPIVSTDCPSGPRELLADGAHGALVPVGDAAQLAKAMARVLRDPPTPEHQIARARLYDLDNIAARYADVILGAPFHAKAAA
jgi:glycosyltransferase involved in cell wall biosynthesis